MNSIIGSLYSSLLKYNYRIVRCDEYKNNFNGGVYYFLSLRGNEGIKFTFLSSEEC
jgi:hypothetical protein